MATSVGLKYSLSPPKRSEELMSNDCFAVLELNNQLSIQTKPMKKN